MEIEKIKQLPEDELINLFQENQITLAQYYQCLPETCEEYMDFCDEHSRHPASEEAAKLFLEFRSKEVDKIMESNIDEYKYPKELVPELSEMNNLK